MFYVYMLRCDDDSLYTGYTTDVEKRLSEHISQGKFGAKYTKSHKAVKIERAWICETRSKAMSLEYFLKSLPKAKKEKLVKNPDLLIFFSNGRFSCNEINAKS